MPFQSPILIVTLNEKTKFINNGIEPITKCLESGQSDFWTLFIFNLFLYNVATLTRLLFLIVLPQTI